MGESFSTEKMVSFHQIFKKGQNINRHMEVSNKSWIGQKKLTQGLELCKCRFKFLCNSDILAYDNLV